jgi:hypothetical protein
MKVIKRIAHNDGSIEKHYDNGTIAWYKNDEVHRDGGEPAVEFSHGTKKWLINGKHHREDGAQYWYFHGDRHRLDGPAIKYGSGNVEYWINGKELSEKEFNTITLQKQLNEELSISQTIVKKPKI